MSYFFKLKHYSFLLLICDVVFNEIFSNFKMKQKYIFLNSYHFITAYYCVLFQMYAM